MHFTREQRDNWIETTRDSPFNVWLRSRTQRPDGTLDMSMLHALAAEYGIDGAAYGHLNSGQQRMNIGNKLRARVPDTVYMDASLIDSGATSPTPEVPKSDREAKRDVGVTTERFDGSSNRDLMRLYARVLDELRTRNVVRTGNAPLGDYAEHLFAQAFGWTLEGNSASGHDAVDAAGRRIQIKARRLRLNVPGERQLSTIRGLPDGKFDVLAAVLFDDRFGIVRAALIPHRIVLQRSSYIAHVNGWRLILDEAVWREPGVKDVTLALAGA